MARKAENTPDPKRIVEKGDIFLFYRPRIDVEAPGALEDVQRFYVALRPSRKRPRIRLLTIGRKRLPDVRSHERSWGFVELVTGSPRIVGRVLGEESYQTKTRGLRNLPAARPSGEGAYAFVRIGHALFLAYELELPQRPEAMQRSLNITRRASFALSIKNPQASTPPDVGLREEQEADYPAELLREFRGRRFASEDVRLLDYEGAEFVLVGALPDARRTLDLDMPAERETAETADIFHALHVARDGQPIEPLLTGSGR